MTTDREEATGVTFLGATECFSVTALLLDGVAVSSLFIVAWWCGEAGGCKCFLARGLVCGNNNKCWVQQSNDELILVFVGGFPLPSLREKFRQREMKYEIQ